MNKKFLGSNLDIENILAIYGLEPKTVKSIKDGIINTSFFIKDQKNRQYVLRVYQNGIHKDKEVLKELQVMELFRQSGIPIPKIIENLKHENLTKFIDSKNKSWQVILMDFVKGHHLKSSEHQIINQFAEFQSKMHKIGSKIKTQPNSKLSFYKMIDWLKKEESKAAKKISNKILKQEYQKITKNILLEVKQYEKEILSLPFGYVHLDYDSNNLIIESNEIRGILDFDDISYQPLVLDSAFSLWWWLFFNPIKIHEDLLIKYKKSYSKYREINKTENKLLPLFIRIRNVTLAALLFINIPKNPDLKLFKKALELDSELKNTK